ncbi:Stp1/IreP family PP2C-type Ser/Thr phosphatase [Evansella sp. AB-rgal1]|uniref:Stp1/IreP family PP2C-type Ser/Thr phosphatase n=1 Tax=Evansella sp. AB-rgal1 TaxID=3242696 RepID=UPI00359E2EC3
MDAVFLTDVGLIRPQNEDDGAFLQDKHGQIIAFVADGMGGHRAGDVASRMTKEILLSKWNDRDSSFTAKEAEQWLEDTIYEVNKQLFQHASDNPECEGMGTTVVVAICNDQFVSIAHVGDSRIYLKTPEEMRQLTNDHTLVGELVRSRQITKDEAMFHPRKNVILRALGTEQSIKVDTSTIHWDEGSSLLLCSDGLTDKLNDDEINELLSSKKSIEEIGKQMIELANDRGGEDNVTVVIVCHHEEHKDVTDE